MPWTYLLRCQDGTFYVGSTKDLDRRMEQHASGTVSAYTAKRLPVQLVWAMEFDRIDEAWELERKLHGWSQPKKLALAEGRYGDLSALSARRTRKRADRQVREVGREE